ncbi:MAG: lipopolysaccharide ABC transporter ATP-binding protein, partial [Gammaproteobacteria bacterium]
MSRLEARDLGKTYSGRKVVESVSLHVDSGEVVGLL